MAGSTLARILRSGRIDWSRVGTRWLPFADAASPDLPLGRLARLALFQVSVGMVAVLTMGTLNRVMIVEIGVAAWLVGVFIALPLLVAPFRALIGLRSDEHRSPLGWRRVPYIWFGSGLQFAGLAIMPFAIVLLGGDTAVQLGRGMPRLRWPSSSPVPARRRCRPPVWRWPPTSRRRRRGRASWR